jgi:hypothetical protein
MMSSGKTSKLALEPQNGVFDELELLVAVSVLTCLT